MKKQLALFICVCLLVNVTSVFATQSSTITSYGFLKSDGSFLNSLDGVASVRAYADIKNSNYADNQNLGLLILECYANNTLIDTNSVTLFVDGNTASKRMVTDEIPIPQGDVYIKTYITYNSQVIFPEIIIDTDNGDESDYNSYLDEIALIEQLEIMGDGTGTEIDAHAPITRAELAVILIKLAAKEYLLPWETGTTPYSDVDESHWASRYISIVTKMGIMGEVSDGKFMPSSMLTYGQVIEALVTLLGYADTVDQWGYIVKANTIGITDGVSIVSNHYANRGKLAKLLVNSLDVPLMTQTGFGTYIEYIINDGTNNTTRRTLLNESFNIIKIKAMVEQTYDLSSSKKESLVQVEVLNAYRSIYGGKGEKFEEDTKVSIDAGKTNLKSFVGYKVIIYLYYDETSGDDPVALYVTKDISSADEITIAASDIEDIVKVGARCYEISYMASKDARSAEKFTVDADAKVYYNGQRDDRTLTTILNNFYGTASFALINPRDTEYDYDTVHISHYENAVVDSVNPIIGRVSVKEGRAIYFGENQPDYSSTLYDIDGKELDWSELEENDILSIRRTVGTNNRTVYVCTLVRNVVEGVIAEKTSEDDAEFKIGGAYYKTDNGIVYPDDLDLQYEGVFYLDIFGRIAYYEAQSSLSSNYAFVIDADVHSSGFENRLSVKAFTFDGEVVIFTGATRIDLIEEDYYSGTRTILRTYRDSGTWGYGFEDLKYKIETATVITFDVNSQGELSRIALPGSRLGEEGVNYFSEYTSGSAFNYRGNDGSIRAGNRTVDISKDTVIMIAGKIAPNSDFEDDDDYNLLSLSMLGSEDIFENFTTTIYNVNKYGVAGLVVVNGQINMAGMTDGLAMVTSISEIENINRLTVLQDGSLKEIDVQKDKNAPTLFSLIAPKLNANGEMFSFDLIAEVAPGNVEFGSGFSNSTYLEHHYGSLTAIKNNKITVDKGYSVTENYTIPQKSNIYLCEYSMLTNACKVKPLDSVNAFEIGFDDDGNLTYTDDRGIKLNKVEVLISKCDYIVQDVIIYAFGDDSAFMQNNVVVVPAVNCSAASAVYQNDTDKNINPVLVLAQYENGRLVGTSQARKSILSGDYGIFNNILKLSPKKGDTIKAMLFDGLGNIKPLLPTDTVNVDGVADLQSAKRILSRSIDFISITEYSISIRYFENPNDNTAKTIHINKNAESFVNGAAYTGKLEDILSSFYGELYLQDLDLSSKYNKVYITHYKNLIVDCINPNTKQIHFKNSSSISYGDSFNNFLTLSDNDGNILDWSMLEENDILSTKITEGANNKTIYDFIFTRNTVEGVAERTSQEDAEFEINGNYYKVDMQNIFPDDLGFENESIFYLDAFGRIAHCEAPTSLRDYAFVIDSMVYSSNMQNKLLLKTFTYDGAVDIFTGAAKISLIEENSTGTKTKLTIYKSDGGDEATDTFGGLKAKIEAATVITFSVNSQGEINKIALPGNRLGEEGVNYFSKYTEGSAFSYRGNDGSIRVGGRAVGISNDTVIMIADKIAPYSNFQNDDDYDLLSLSVLGSEDIEENYNTTVYDVNKNGIAGLIVVSGQVNVAGAASGLAMVTNISTIRSEDGGIIDRLTVFQGRETKQIEVLEGKDTPDLFSLVAPQLSARGKLTNYGLIASVYGRMVELGSGFANTSKVDYAFGGVTAIRNNRVTIDVGSGVTESYTIPPNANIYLYDGRMTTNARKAKIVDSINIFDVEGSYYGYVYYDEQGFMLDNVQVLIRRYDGRIQDVVVFFNTTLKEGYWDLDW